MKISVEHINKSTYLEEIKKIVQSQRLYEEFYVYLMSNVRARTWDSGFDGMLVKNRRPYKLQPFASVSDKSKNLPAQPTNLLFLAICRLHAAQTSSPEGNF